MSETFKEWLARKYPNYERSSHKLGFSLTRKLVEEYRNEVES